MIKIRALEHVSWAAGDLEKAGPVLALFGFAPTGGEDIPAQHVTSSRRSRRSSAALIARQLER